MEKKRRKDERQKGESKYSMSKLFAYAIEGILDFSTKPLIISAFFGLLFCLIAFIMIIVVIVKTLIWGDPVGGWPSLACIIFFIGGIQLFCI
ncbi:MAG: glycosyltransferase, partial [Agathobacter sp.]|nr:glycosyltransferase [Agathobacter sp.]